MEDADVTAAADDSDDSAVKDFFLGLIPGSSLYYAYLDYQKGNYVGAALNGVEGLADLATVGSMTRVRGGLKLFVRFMKARVKDELVNVAATDVGNAVAERLGPEAGYVTQEIVSAALSRRTSQQNKRQIGFAADGKKIKGSNAPIRPSTRADLHIRLREQGFEFPSTSSLNRYVTYRHNDGRVTTIKPTGEVITTRRVWKADRSGKFNQRIDFEGNVILDQSHFTGYFLEPID